MWNQVLLFEKPMFQGECIEVEMDIYNFDEGEEEKAEEDETDITGRERLSSVGSLKILSGLWVHFGLISKSAEAARPSTITQLL